MRFESGGEYESKNRAFFARLASAPVNTTVVYWQAEENEYFDVLGLAGDTKLEAIPSPVFAQVAGLADENYLEVIRGFLGSWFRFVVRTRDEWNCLTENDVMA